MQENNNYSPLYFLSALGAGGLSVSFYMYLMFLVPHKGSPMATFDFIYIAILQANYISVIAIISLFFILVFSTIHFKLLIWNVKQYLLYKHSESYKILVTSNAEVSLMALPLTFAMTINVSFVLGAIFIPGLWDYVEYLFPFALLAFMGIGYLALKIFFEYFNRLLVTGDFDCTQNNNLSQMLSIFAFSMLAVGFAAPGAMSHNLTINAIGLFGAIFFSTIALLILLIKLILGFKNMFEHGISPEASPSLWILIPILTLLGITFIRINFGLDHHFDQVMAKSSLFTLTSSIITLQIIFGMMGYKLMKSISYFEEFIHSEKKSPVSFALICPGVAFVIFGMFFINFGLELNGIIDKYSFVYFLFILPLTFLQFKTIQYFFILKKKFSL